MADDSDYGSGSEEEEFTFEEQAQMVGEALLSGSLKRQVEELEVCMFGTASFRALQVLSLFPPLAFDHRPRRLSTPSDAHELHPDVRSYGTTLSGVRQRRRRDDADV